jgi:hypothetical protein
MHAYVLMLNHVLCDVKHFGVRIAFSFSVRWGADQRQQLEHLCAGVQRASRTSPMIHSQS